jgi:hypothetical protein
VLKLRLSVIRVLPVIPAGLAIKAPLDRVTLTAEKVSVKLTEVVKALARLVWALENASTQVSLSFPTALAAIWGLPGRAPGPNNTWVIPAQDPWK